MYLGFFFIHWSEGEVTQVYQSEPEQIDECPFCNKPSDVIYKIYNTKTKHYSAFSIGRGDFQITFTCRNCTNEGKISDEVGSIMIHQYLIYTEYDKICELHNTNQEKAKKKLERFNTQE